MDENHFFELATRILSGEASPQEKASFESFLEQDGYRSLFNWIKAQWEKGQQPVSGLDYQRGLEKLRAKIQKAEAASGTNKKATILSFVTWRVAATVTVALGLCWYAFGRFTSPAIETITQTTLRGQRKIVTLPDGSTVALNAETVIQYPAKFDDNRREISLQGEAFFEVIKDPESPFNVNTDKLTTTVLGTSFNVHAYEHECIRVAVRTGKVKVAGDSLKIFLTPGEQVTVNERTGEVKKERVDMNLAFDWKEGVLIFDEIRLEDAITLMERWYGIHITCESPALLNRTLRGRYKNEDLKTVMSDLQFMIGFNFNIVNKDSLVITE